MMLRIASEFIVCLIPKKNLAENNSFKVQSSSVLHKNFQNAGEMKHILWENTNRFEHYALILFACNELFMCDFCSKTHLWRWPKSVCVYDMKPHKIYGMQQAKNAIKVKRTSRHHCLYMFSCVLSLFLLYFCRCAFTGFRLGLIEWCVFVCLEWLECRYE